MMKDRWGNHEKESYLGETYYCGLFYTVTKIEQEPANTASWQAGEANDDEEQPPYYDIHLWFMS